MQWLRDQLGIISGAAESEALARQVDDTGGVYFVPAFSGLFAPYWRADARGAIVGLSRFNTNAHLARATLEAICYQSRDVVEAMAAGFRGHLDVLKVDGGVTANDLCMQLQADILGVPVSRPVVAETTALGAAYAAGLAAGFWRDTAELRANWHESKPLGAHLDRGPPRGRLRRLEEGGRPHPGLGRRWVSRSVERRFVVVDVRMPVTVEPVGDVAAVLGEGPYWRPEDETLIWVDVPRGLLHMTRVQLAETITIELGHGVRGVPGGRRRDPDRRRAPADVARHPAGGGLGRANYRRGARQGRASSSTTPRWTRRAGYGSAPWTSRRRNRSVRCTGWTPAAR